MTWAPGLPLIIQDRLISGGGWFERKGVSCFNLYKPPTIRLGDASKAGPWLNHVRKVYPSDADHIIKWCAHRVQHPDDKVNHALLLGGAQGIGKDTILEPVKSAVGPWNFADVSPQQMLGRFTGFLKSVILRVNEGRDLGDVNRYAFYEHLKDVITSPPDVLRVDEKNLREYNIPKLVGLIITTNNKTTGLYLPEDDRRHYVAWSDLTKESFEADYWKTLYDWYDNGGREHVAAYLNSLDLSTFDAKAPPPRTDAWWAIVDANRAPEESELADALDSMGNPDAVTVDMLMVEIGRYSELATWFGDRRNRRAIPHRFEACGYLPVRSDAKDGLWVMKGRRQVIYAKAALTLTKRIAAADELAKPAEGVANQ
jgi:hypothetical protein